MSPDLRNALFELVGVVFGLESIRKLLNHREIRGISLKPSAFYCAWGFSNLFYFNGLNQPLSLVAGGLMFVVNTVWLSLALRFRARQ